MTWSARDLAYLACAGLLGSVALPGLAEGADVPVVFQAEHGALELTPADIAEAAPWFDNGAAGVNLRLSGSAARGLADLTGAAIGQTMTFSVCGETLVSATVQAPIEGGRISAVIDGLGAATWYARILRGEIGCDGTRPD